MFFHSRLSLLSCLLPAHSALSHKHTLSFLRCILVSGVLCFSSQGREESRLGSKLTINTTFPEPRTRSNTSTYSLLLLLLHCYSSLYFFLITCFVIFLSFNSPVTVFSYSQCSFLCFLYLHTLSFTISLNPKVSNIVF